MQHEVEGRYICEDFSIQSWRKRSLCCFRRRR